MIYKVTLNGKLYQVEVEKGEAILLDVSEVAAIAAPAAPVAPAAAPVAAAPVAAAPAVALAAGEVVSAPLPGTVLEIKATVGQAVKKGQLLLIIEAMKMENEILAPRDGTVSQIVCEKSKSVNTGDPLVVLS